MGFLRGQSILQKKTTIGKLTTVTAEEVADMLAAQVGRVIIHLTDCRWQHAMVPIWSTLCKEPQKLVHLQLANCGLLLWIFMPFVAMLL